MSKSANDSEELPLATSREVLCAWCGKQIRPGVNPSGDRRLVSHGICLDCMALEGNFPIEDLCLAEEDLLDRLPFGVVRMRGNGKIISYNEEEARHSRLAPEAVIGRNFFGEVAPCTRVRELAGHLEQMQLGRRSCREEVAFVFRFPHGAMLVRIVLAYDAEQDVCTLLIKPMAEETRATASATA